MTDIMTPTPTQSGPGSPWELQTSTHLSLHVAILARQQRPHLPVRARTADVAGGDLGGREKRITRPSRVGQPLVGNPTFRTQHISTPCTHSTFSYFPPRVSYLQLILGLLHLAHDAHGRPAGGQRLACTWRVATKALRAEPSAPCLQKYEEECCRNKHSAVSCTSMRMRSAAQAQTQRTCGAAKVKLHVVDLDPRQGQLGLVAVRLRFKGAVQHQHQHRRGPASAVASTNPEAKLATIHANHKTTAICASVHRGEVHESGSPHLDAADLHRAQRTHCVACDIKVPPVVRVPGGGAAPVAMSEMPVGAGQMTCILEVVG